jgi:hypothetical protein
MNIVHHSKVSGPNPGKHGKKKPHGIFIRVFYYISFSDF